MDALSLERKDSYMEPYQYFIAPIMTDEGFLLDVKCYKHDAQPAPEPESE